MKNLNTKLKEQEIIEEYFNQDVELIKGSEFKINGSWYQVQPEEYINSSEELMGIAEGSPIHQGYYIIKQ